MLWAGTEAGLLVCGRSVWLWKRSDLSCPEYENLGQAGGLGDTDAVVGCSQIKRLAPEKPLG